MFLLLQLEKRVVVLNGLQHIVCFLPLHGQHLSFTFSFVVPLQLLLMIVFPPTIFLSLLWRLKDIIGSPWNVLANFSFIFKIGQCFLMIWETFGRDICCKILPEGYNWHYCHFRFLEVGFFLWYYLLNFFFYGISFITSFHNLLYKFGGFIIKCSDYRSCTILVLMLDSNGMLFLGKVDVQTCFINRFGDQSLYGKQWFEYFALSLYKRLSSNMKTFRLKWQDQT